MAKTSTAAVNSILGVITERCKHTAVADIKKSCANNLLPPMASNTWTADYSEDFMRSSTGSSTDKITSVLHLTSPPCILAVLPAGSTPWLASASLRLPPASSPRMSSSAYAAGAKRSSISIRVMASSLVKCREEGATATDSSGPRAMVQTRCWCANLSWVVELCHCELVACWGLG